MMKALQTLLRKIRDGVRAAWVRHMDSLPPHQRNPLWLVIAMACGALAFLVAFAHWLGPQVYKPLGAAIIVAMFIIASGKILTWIFPSLRTKPIVLPVIGAALGLPILFFVWIILWA